MTDWFNSPSNFSNGTKSVEGLGTLMQYANEVTNNILGSLIVGMTLIIVYLVLGGTKSAMTSALFIATIFAVLFARIGMINPVVPLAGIIFLVISMIITKTSNEY